MQLEQFLVNAKTACYAGGAVASATIAPVRTVLADGCIEFTWHDGPFSYRDRYFGENPFAGEEVVWQDGQAVWVMNYYGQVLDERIPPGPVYAFLQRAMGLVQTDRPYRGPSYLQEMDFEYFDESQGGPNQFSGMESICFQGREIYRLLYHGGRLKA